MNFSAKNYWVFRFSFFQKLFPFNTCKILSPPSPFPTAHHHATHHHRVVLHQISFPFPSRVAGLISWAPLSPPPNTAASSFLFSPVHPSHLPFWQCASPALLWIWIPPFSCCLQFLSPLQKDFREPGLLYAALSLDNVPGIPVMPSLPVCIPFPTSQPDRGSEHLLSYMGCVPLLYPPHSTALCSSLATASFHLPFFQAHISLPSSGFWFFSLLSSPPAKDPNRILESNFLLYFPLSYGPRLSSSLTKGSWPTNSATSYQPGCKLDCLLNSIRMLHWLFQR